MKSVREQIANHCAFFNGLQHDTCKAGCRYIDLRRGNVFPCLKQIGSNDGESVHCEKRRWLTEEEIQAELSEIEAESNKFAMVIPVIQQTKRQHKGHNWSGVVECPVCKGRLHLRHASFNGHIWGRCETKDCVAWME